MNTVSSQSSKKEIMLVSNENRRIRITNNNSHLRSQSSSSDQNTLLHGVDNREEDSNFTVPTVLTIKSGNKTPIE